MIRQVQRPWLWGGIGAVILAAPALALRVAPAPVPIQAPYAQPVSPPLVSLGQPVRYSGQVTDGLYASLRAAGVNMSIAQQSLRALAPHVDFATEMTAETRFDLVVSQNGAGETSPLYIGVYRPDRAVQLVPIYGAAGLHWQNAADGGGGASGLVQPVPAAHLSSGFGLRWHPLLGYSRFHQGVDYAAASGTPIYAVADGKVAQAGWAGGYGQMVRLAHNEGVGTGYAHMSRIVVSPGDMVRQGQIIGYVGSTGLSTGPHLHFEVYRSGVAIDPAGFTQIARPALSPQQRHALQARVRRLLAHAVSAPPLGG